MSIQAMAWAIEQQDVTDAPARHVLLCLANYADHEGRGAFPSVQRLAQETGLSERTVRYKLDALEQAEAIEKGDQRLAEVYISRGDRRPTVYDIPGVRGAARAPRRGTGCSSRQNGVQLTTERGAGAAPDPSSNHQGSDLSLADASARAATDAGKACRLMREAGCASTNPSNPKLLDALREGVTPQALADTVREGRSRDSPIEGQGLFAWAIQTARGRNADAARAPAPRSNPKEASHAAHHDRSAVGRVAARVAAHRAGGEFADEPANDPATGDVVDGELDVVATG